MANWGASDQLVTVRVVVVAENDGRTMAESLDSLVPQAAGLEVVVVDQNSDDDGADVAIRHARTDRVLMVAGGSLQRVITTASKEAQRLLVLSADALAAPGWVDAALAGLDEAPLVFGPDRSIRNVALDLARLRHLDLFAGAEDLDEVLRRVRHAGFCPRMAKGMRLSPATPVSVPVTSGPLPVSDPPGPGPRFEGPLTVVLCTRDRPDHLSRCLASLSRLDDADHQIIVVDNHPSPVVRDLDFPPRARLVHEPTAGLDAARNRGLAETTDEVVVYIDDDCEADPHWLTALRASFADPLVGLVTGRVRPASLALPTQRYFETNFTFDRGFIRKRFTAWDDRPWYPLWTGPLGTGCNMAFRRDVLLDVDGFDELLDVGSTIGGGGDLDAFARVLDRGVTAEYAPDALVWHHHRDTMSGLRRQFRGYGEASGAYLVKAFLDRPGLRFTAVRYLGSLLAGRLRAARDIRSGHRLVPMPLLVTYLLGLIVGPFRYLRARRAASAAATR